VASHHYVAGGATGASLYYTTYAGGGQVRRIDYAVTPPPAATLTSLPPCRAIDTRVNDARAAGEWDADVRADGPLRRGPRAAVQFRGGQTRANNAVLGLFGTPTGSVTVTTTIPSGTVHVIVDVTGYWQ
jgi:hypothetical protein